MKTKAAGFSFEIHTDRLALEPVRANDAAAFQLILNDPYVRKFLLDDTIVSLEQVAAFIKESEDCFRQFGGGLWLLKLNEDSTVVGFAGLRSFFDEVQPQLIYALLPEFTGKGLAYEAATRIVRYCFDELGFEYLIASCDAPNTTSQLVAERLGMTKTMEALIDERPTYFYRLSDNAGDGRKPADRINKVL